MLTKLATLLGGAVLFGATVCADAWDKKTVLTVNETIQVPGAVLQPGKYVLKLVESQSNRHIVRILNEAETEVITTTLAIPNYRLTPTGNTQFLFWEMPANNPPALRAWFYPGDNFGQEFAYPRVVAAAIAEKSPVQVPVTTAEKEAELLTAPLATEPEQQPGLVAQAAPTLGSDSKAAEPDPPVPASLPQTAGFGPLLVFLGVIALTVGAALRSCTYSRR